MRVFKFLFRVAVTLILIGIGAGGFAVWYFGRDLPDYQQLADYQPPIVTRVHAGDGRLLGEYATEKRVFVPVNAIPPLLIHAFLAAEDRNFYTHPGINPLAMLRAGATDMVRLFTHRRPEGASTITQQVAKNFLVGSELSYGRKIREALIALRIEQVLSKDRILELYLNEIYLGGGAYGAAAASLTYFNKSLEELTVEEAAFLAALPKGPSNYNPVRYPEAAKTRRDWVIDRMAKDGFISPAQAAAALAQPLATRRRDDTETVAANYFAEEVRRELIARYGDKGLYQAGLSVRTSLDPALQSIADTSLRAGLIAYDQRHGWRGPVAHIEGGADWRMQLATTPLPEGAGEAGWKLALVREIAADGAMLGFADGTAGRIPLDELRWARKALADNQLGPVPRKAADVVGVGDVVLVERLATDNRDAAAPRFALRQIPEVSGALVALDPHTGRVLAMTGGFSYELSQFNRATQARRQIGSAIKPFVYLAALDHGFTPSTIVLDAPFVVDQGPGLPKWKPSNYTHKFYGPLPLRVGVEQSRNLMTARLGQMVGLDIVGQYIERFGVMEHMPRQYAMVLGAGETTPLKLTTAYAMLVNGGKRITPSFIDRVQDRNGVTIFRADQRPCEGCRDIDWQKQHPPEIPDTREDVADPASAYQIVSILQGVVERGTGHIIASVGKPLAGKTGTTNDSNDTWFVGFSPDLAVGIFVGYDTPRSLGAHETGGSVAAPIFRDFVAAALKDTPAIPFRIPPGIRLVRVNATTGELAQAGDRNVIYESFKPGTEPTSDSPVVGGQAIGDDEDAASLPQPVGAFPQASDGNVAAPAGGEPETSALPPRTAPQSGSGGLY